MLYPTIDELTQGNFNRYELALATAKCARLITDEYVRQHELVEKSATGNKEADRALSATIDRELRDEKAVKVAINRIYRGEYSIAQDAEGETVETVDVAEATAESNETDAEEADAATDATDAAEEDA